MSDTTVIDADYDGIIVVDLDDRIEQEGIQEPLITWRIPYSHAENLADALESIDRAKEALMENGDASWAYHDREAKAIRDGLALLETAGLIFRTPTPDGWYAQVHTCEKCGCTDITPCDPPCRWATCSPRICSRCAA